MTHIEEHCAKPNLTRHWTRLGAGALWMCSCGVLWRLTARWGFEGDTSWTWEKVEK